MTKYEFKLVDIAIEADNKAVKEGRRAVDRTIRITEVMNDYAQKGWEPLMLNGDLWFRRAITAHLGRPKAITNQEPKTD